MKRLGFVIMGVLVALVVLSAGCAPKPAASPTHNVTGVLKDINIPAEPGPDVVTIQTPQGEQVFSIDTNTKYFIAGSSCSLDEINVAASGNASYNCTLVFDDEMGLIAIYATK